MRDDADARRVRCTTCLDVSVDGGGSREAGSVRDRRRTRYNIRNSWFIDLAADIRYTRPDTFLYTTYHVSVSDFIGALRQTRSEFILIFCMKILISKPLFYLNQKLFTRQRKKMFVYIISKKVYLNFNTPYNNIFHKLINIYNSTLLNYIRMMMSENYYCRR